MKQNSFKLRKHRQAGEHWRSTVVFKILESSCLLLQKQLQHRELMHAWEIWKALAPLKTPSSSEENIHRLRKHLSTRKRFLSWKHVAKAAKAKEDSLKKIQNYREIRRRQKIARITQFAMHRGNSDNAAAMQSTVMQSKLDYISQNVFRLQKSLMFRASYRLIRRVFWVWRQYSRKVRHYRANTRRADKKWRMGSLRIHFKGWVRASKLLKTKRRAVLLLIIKNTGYILHDAFVHWQNQLVHIDRKMSSQHSRRALLRRIVSREFRYIAMRSLVMGWQRWRGFVSMLRQHQARERHMHRLLQHLKHREVGSALRVWRDYSRKCKRLEQLLRKVTKRVIHSVQAKTWCSWHGFLGRKRLLRKYVMRATNRRRNSYLKHYINRWVRQHFNVSNMQTTMDMIVLRLRHLRDRKLTSGLRQWKLYTHKQRELEHTQKGVARRWQRLHLHRAFKAFLDRTAERKAKRVRIQRLIAKLKYRNVYAYFSKWFNVADLQNQQRFVLGHALSRRRRNIVRHSLVMGWQRWRGFVSMLRQHQARERQMHRLLQHLKHREVGSALRVWRDYSRKCKCLKHAILLASQGRKRIAFHRWKYNYRPPISARNYLSKGSQWPAGGFAFFGGMLCSVFLLVLFDSILLDSVKQLFYFGKNLT